MKGRWLFCLFVCMTMPLLCFALPRVLFGASPMQAIGWTIAQGAVIAGVCVWVLMRQDVERSVEAKGFAMVARAAVRFALLWFVFSGFLIGWLTFVPIFLLWFR